MIVRGKGEGHRVERDLREAHSLISRLRGLTVEDSAVALHDHAVLTGVTVHAAALAVLAEWHPVGQPRHRGPAAAHTYSTGDRNGRIVVRWQGRERAHLAVKGIGSDDLAVRLRQAVERALRAGATHLIVDTRGATDADQRLDEVLGWAGRRLWARRGVLVVRATEPHSSVADAV
jgi:hypothetical protein